MNMQLLKTSGTFFLSSIKKLRKTLLGEGRGSSSTPPVRPKADKIHKALFLWKLVYTLNFLRIT